MFEMNQFVNAMTNAFAALSPVSIWHIRIIWIDVAHIRWIIVALTVTTWWSKQIFGYLDSSKSQTI